MLTDLHRLKIQMEGKRLKAKQWVITPDGVGLLVSVDLIHPQSGHPYAKPMNVVVRGQSKMYAQQDVRACTFPAFCIQPTAFGQTPWVFIALLIAITGLAIHVGEGWWTLIAWVPMLGATYANWKRWFK
jgi:hypothetical protein